MTEKWMLDIDRMLDAMPTLPDVEETPEWWDQETVALYAALQAKDEEDDLPAPQPPATPRKRIGGYDEAAVMRRRARKRADEEATSSLNWADPSVSI